MQFYYYCSVYVLYFNRNLNTNKILTLESLANVSSLATKSYDTINPLQKLIYKFNKIIKRLNTIYHCKENSDDGTAPSGLRSLSV